MTLSYEWIPSLSISVIDWHKMQIIFLMNIQWHIGQNVFILSGIQNTQNIQLNLLLVHRQNGSFSSVIVPKVCQVKVLPPVILCFVLGLCYISVTAPFISCLAFQTELSGLLYAFCVSHHAVLQFSGLHYSSFPFHLFTIVLISLYLEGHVTFFVEPIQVVVVDSSTRSVTSLEPSRLAKTRCPQDQFPSRRRSGVCTMGPDNWTRWVAISMPTSPPCWLSLTC